MYISIHTKRILIELYIVLILLVFFRNTLMCEKSVEAISTGYNYRRLHLPAHKTYVHTMNVSNIISTFMFHI